MARPTKYKKKFCEMLVAHMKEGGSFRSFGAVAECSIDTLYEWETQHVEFSDARKKGEPLLEQFYQKMGLAMATGQLKFLKKEEPMLDGEGKPVIDPRTGGVVMRKEYGPAMGNAAAWIFMCKNILGWSDKRALAISGDGKGGPISLRPVNATPEEKFHTLQEMHKLLLEAGKIDTDFEPPSFDEDR